MSTPSFSVETIDGVRIGRLSVPYPQIADWLNFLCAPHYSVDMVSAEQDSRGVDLYFEANEGVYLYLETRFGQPVPEVMPDVVIMNRTQRAIAS